MKNALICLSLLCMAYPLCGEATMYKCTNENSVVYQDTPCSAGQAPINLASVPVNLASVPVRLLEPDTASPLELKNDPLPPSQLQSTSLALGMSDTQVLNMHGWGRPGKITRSKSGRAWREEWTYFSPQDEPRQLQFANGKLASIQ